MPGQTVELAREVLEALGERDLARLIAFADPEVEWHSFFAELGESWKSRVRLPVLSARVS